MQSELYALVKNGTWKMVVEPVKNTNDVYSKWVLKLKFGADGDVEPCKTRFVALGFSQKYGVDFIETFAPVINLSSVWLFCCSCELAWSQIAARSRPLRLHEGQLARAYLHEFTRRA